MARNQSEKLPSCPEAHAYADTVDLFFENKTPHLPLANLWWKIPGRIRARLGTGVPNSGHDGEDMYVGDRRWRREMARRIRAWYGA